MYGNSVFRTKISELLGRHYFLSDIPINCAGALYYLQHKKGVNELGKHSILIIINKVLQFSVNNSATLTLISRKREANKAVFAADIVPP